MTSATTSTQSPIADHGTRSASLVFRTPPATPGFAGEGHTAVAVVHPDGGYHLDPFVLLADDRLDFETHRAIGEPHPHAGLETVTLVIEGNLHDRDEGDLATGDVLWMSAGRGVIHNESVRTEGHLRALQLWIALPAAERDSEPDYELVRGADAPVVRQPGVTARLYSGESNGLRSATRNRTPITMLDVILQPGATFRHDMPSEYNGFAYLLDGTALVGGEMAAAGEVAVIGPAAGTGLHLTAGVDGARVVLYTGRPTNARVLARGPFVAGSPDEISEYARRYRAGQFTRLSALAARRAGAAAAH